MNDEYLDCIRSWSYNDFRAWYQERIQSNSLYTAERLYFEYVQRCVKRNAFFKNFYWKKEFRDNPASHFVLIVNEADSRLVPQQEQEFPFPYGELEQYSPPTPQPVLNDSTPEPSELDQIIDTAVDEAVNELLSELSQSKPTSGNDSFLNLVQSVTKSLDSENGNMNPRVDRDGFKELIRAVSPDIPVEEFAETCSNLVANSREKTQKVTMPDPNSKDLLDVNKLMLIDYIERHPELQIREAKHIIPLNTIYSGPDNDTDRVLREVVPWGYSYLEQIGLGQNVELADTRLHQVEFNQSYLSDTVPIQSTAPFQLLMKHIYLQRLFHGNYPIQVKMELDSDREANVLNAVKETKAYLTMKRANGRMIYEKQKGDEKK